ncbi:MAG: (Fe-S)-binding protein [Candidatus Kryptonium sp.]|nr:(Fe-S)-binding protein [Candidatus Kryptonium sp.]
MKVALFIPCYIDQFYPEVGVATVKILKKFGIKFDYPLEQTCCGQPAFNTGYWKEAKSLAIKFVKIFSNFDYIVSPSGSCTSMIKIFYPELLNEDELKNIMQKTFELTEFLVKIMKIDSTGAEFDHKITYHDSCHALRELGIKKEPRILLRNVKKLKLIEMENSEDCCGFGGTFSIKFPEISIDMAKYKLNYALNSGAEFITSTDQSCLMHIDGYARKNKINIKTIHIAQILANF